DESDHPDIGQLQLTRVDDLDREDVVAYSELTQREPPRFHRREEVGDHHGHAAAARRPVEHVDQRAEVVAAGPDRGTRDLAQQPVGVLAAGTGGVPYPPVARAARGAAPRGPA